MDSSHHAMTTEEFIRKEVFKSSGSSKRDTRTHRNDLQTEYWKVIPNEGACEKCQAMGEGVHWEKPERPHPNCKCEIIPGSIRVGIFKTLEGWRDTGSEVFTAGQSINVTIINRGLGLGGVWVTVDGTVTRSTGHMRYGSSKTFHFSKFGEIPLTWQVELMSDGADECFFEYKIRN